MKKILAILAVALAFGFASQPTADPRPDATNRGTCFAQVDWDARHNKDLTYPWSVKWNDPRYQPALTAWYAYILPRNQVCIDKFPA